MFGFKILDWKKDFKILRVSRWSSMTSFDFTFINNNRVRIVQASIKSKSANLWSSKTSKINIYGKNYIASRFWKSLFWIVPRSMLIIRNAAVHEI